jgi:hypothetical protein
LTIIIFLLLISAQAALAAEGILYVAEDGNCGGPTPCYETLQEAVDAALPGDEIRVAAGTYPLSAGVDQIALVEKSLTIRGGFTNGNWTTPDPEANPTILNALGQGRAMVISGTVEVTVDGLHMTYGNADGLGGATDGSDAGGALYINGADVTLLHSWIMTSTTPSDGAGGGMYVIGSPTGFLMEDCIVQGNYANTGGGVYLREITSTLTNNLIQNNDNEDFGSGAGLRIYNGYASLSGNLISSNEGGNGAGIAINGAEVRMDHNTIENNTTWAGGGGILIGSATVLMEQNLLQGNSAQKGGGMDVGSSTLTMLFNTLLGNNTDQGGSKEGGAINLYNAFGGPTVIYGNRFEGNWAAYGGAIVVYAGSEPVLIEGNQFLGNQAIDPNFSGIGGALNISADNVEILRNLFQGNSAVQGTNTLSVSYGGAMAIYNDATLSNNIITGNSASGSNPHAPGVYVNSCTPELYHNTIANNTGAEGSGVYVRQEGDDGEPGRPILYNNLIVSQTVGVYVSDESSQNLATLYGVLWWNNDSNYAGTVFAFDEVTGDPLFVDAAGYDYHISDGSAAIDQSPDNWLIVDFDFEPRYGIPDLGADEYWAPGALKRVYLALVVKSP